MKNFAHHSPIGCPRRACAARVTVVVLCVCVCVFVCPGRSSATHATKRQTRHTHGLSILLAPELIWRFSYNGFVSKIAIAFPYLRPHGSRPFLYAKRACSLCVCVCLCVQAAHLRLTQLSDKLART